MAQRNLRARYQVKGPRKETVNWRQYHIDENGALQYEEKSDEMDCYMVYFPHGHSIRVTSYDKLKELGYHIKPRIIDMDTGDVVELGGDPYDFASGNEKHIVLAHEDGEVLGSRKRRTADASA